MNLDQEKLKAIKEVRAALVERLGCFHFTDKMLESRSVFQLLCLLQLVTGHRNWLGQFSHTAYALDQIFGYDATHEEPKVEPEKTTVVN